MSRGPLAAALAVAILILSAPATASASFSFPLNGWWPMNDGRGQTVRDWSGRGNHGFLGSTTGADANDPSWVKGVFWGSALRFDGVDDYITIPNKPALQPAKLTVAAWVKNNGSPGEFKYIVAKGSYACDHSSWGLYTGPNGGLAFYIADQNQFYRSAMAEPTVWDGQWHHVAGTFDGDRVKLFVDGAQVGDAVAADTEIDYQNPVDGGGMIGAFPDGANCWHGPLSIVGDVDGVQLWSQALPVDTIWKALKALFSSAR